MEMFNYFKEQNRQVEVWTQEEPVVIALFEPVTIADVSQQMRTPFQTKRISRGNIPQTSTEPLDLPFTKRDLTTVPVGQIPQTGDNGRPVYSVSELEDGVWAVWIRGSIGAYHDTKDKAMTHAYIAARCRNGIFRQQFNNGHNSGLKLYDHLPIV